MVSKKVQKFQKVIITPTRDAEYAKHMKQRRKSERDNKNIEENKLAKYILDIQKHNMHMTSVH